MANEQRGEVGIDVRGKRYTLKPTFNGLCDLEELTGKSFADVIKDAQAGTARGVRLLVWSYLQEHHADEIKTVRDAGNWVLDAGGMGRVSAALKRLAVVNTPDTPARAAGRPQRAASGPGTTSKSKPDAAA